HLRQAAEAWPVSAASNEPLLHAVREHVPHPLEQRGLVENRFRGVAALPEAPAPSDQPSHLLRDVRQQVLHERGEIPARCADDEVNVAGDDAERVELHTMKTNCTRQYAAEDVVRLR